jgi:hypothetical protein
VWIRILRELTEALRLGDIGDPQDDDSEAEWPDGGIYTGLKLTSTEEELQKRKARVLACYWASHQRFFRALCVAMKVDYRFRFVRTVTARHYPGPASGRGGEEGTG